jgi:hypothetical protein
MKRIAVLGMLLAGMLAGCAGTTELIPNSDPALRRKPPEFAADAARRHPYKADAPRGGEAVARAQVGYSADKLEIVNLSDQEWDDVELWVNQDYVVFIPVMKPGKLESIPFQAIFNGYGQSFPTDNRTPAQMVNKVELYHGGKMYDVTVKLAD